MRKIVSSILVTLLLASVFYVTIVTVESESVLFVMGSGTENDPYQIKDVDDLQNIKDDLNAHYILVNDIDASVTENWNDGMGFLSLGDSENRFRGSFDGQDYSIDGLYIHRPDDYHVGLFGFIGRNAKITDVNLENVDITGYDFVGALCGGNFEGNILDSHIDGYVGGNIYVGGLIGWSTGIIEDSSSAGDVSGSESVGGLVGYNNFPESQISNSYSTADVSVTNNEVGGLVGLNRGTVVESNAEGEVTGYDYVGGLIGLNRGKVINSLASGEVSGNDYIGGLVGWNTFIIEDSSILGSVDGNNHVGGLVGTNTGTIETSHSMGTVNGIKEVGGLLGSNNGTVSDSYAEGAVTGESFVGGLAGWSTDIIEGSFAMGIVKGIENVGGLLGRNVRSSSYVIDSFATGDVEGQNNISGLVGINEGTVLNSYSEGYVTGYHTSGGLVGVNRNKVIDSYALGDVSGGNYTGGLVGWNRRNIESSYAEGNVSGISDIGGLAGVNDGKVYSSFSTGHVSGIYYVGGLVAWNRDFLYNSYTTGNVNGSDYIGGLVGWNNNTIEKSYATGIITGDNYVGGLSGVNRGTITNSYALGDTGGVNYVGGLAGYNNLGSVSKSYSIGVVDGSHHVGGLVGMNTGIVESSFWDNQTSNQDESAGGTGKTTEEMKAIETYTHLETDGLDNPWDFVGNPNDDEGDENIWFIDGTHQINDGYPFLVTTEVEIKIEPSQDQTITANDVIYFDASAYIGEDLVTDVNTDFTWQNTDENGLFDTTTVGEYEVTAIYQEVTSNSVMVTVEPSEVDLVEIEPSEEQTISASETIEFDARAYDQYDNLITEENADFSWQNTDENGLFDTTTAGEYEVTATYQEVPSRIVTVIVQLEVDGPEFEFSNLRISPEKPVVGEDIEFMINVTNVGGSTGESNVSFYIDGELIGSENVVVEPGETVTASVIHIIDEVGDYELEVFGESIRFTVSEDEEYNMLWLLVPVIVIIAVFILFIFFTRSKESEKTV